MGSIIKKVILVCVLGGFALAGALYYLNNRGKEHTDDAQIEGRIVYLSPKISGYLSQINIEDNQHVKAGDVLAIIDTRDYELAIKQAEAQISGLKSGVSASNESLESSKITAPSTIAAAEANVARAKADYDRTLSDYNRKSKLTDLAISTQGKVDAKTAMQAALSSLNDAKANLAAAQSAPRTVSAAQAQTEQAQAQVEQAQAALAQAQLNLDHTKIIAPFDGHITKRTIEPGMLVQPGQQIITLVSDDYWVVANFKETQLQNMKIGNPVEIEIDAFPGTAYKGHVASFQKGTGARFSAFPPENATGNFVKVVQRVPVKILFDEKPDAALAIGPGMSVVPTVTVQ